MSRIDIEWDDKVFAKHLNYIRSQLEKEISTIIEEGGQDIVNIASMTAPKQYGFLRASLGKTNPSLITGRTVNVGCVKKGTRQTYHIASAKTPPLKGVWRLEKDADSVSLEVGSGMNYARAMEYYHEAYSIKDKSRKLIRMREGRSPYLAPAFAMATPKVIKKLKALIGKVLNAKG